MQIAGGALIAIFIMLAVVWPIDAQYIHLDKSEYVCADVAVYYNRPACISYQMRTEFLVKGQEK